MRRRLLLGCRQHSRLFAVRFDEDGLAFRRPRRALSLLDVHPREEREPGDEEDGDRQDRDAARPPDPDRGRVDERAEESGELLRWEGNKKMTHLGTVRHRLTATIAVLVTVAMSLLAMAAGWVAWSFACGVARADQQLHGLNSNGHPLNVLLKAADDAVVSYVEIDPRRHRLDVAGDADTKNITIMDCIF